MNLAFTKTPPQAKASTPWPAFQTKHNTSQATCVTNDDAFFDTTKSALSLALPMPPSMGTTCLSHLHGLQELLQCPLPHPRG